MSPPAAALPPGYRAECLDTVDSTNSEARRRAAHGEAGDLWIRARTQTAGRGREQRHWESIDGNLFASLLLRPRCSVRHRPQLAFVAGLALFDTAEALGGAGVRDRLRLKWPNDLLLDGAKLGGVLIESVGTGGPAEGAVVIGSGLNLASHPPETALTATSLAANGVPAPADAAFGELAHATAHWLERWSEGAGWADIRASWAASALAERAPIRVRTGADITAGTYGGIDEDGALILHTSSGETRKIMAGDVFPL